MNGSLLSSFVILREELKRATEKNETNVELWKSFVRDMPYCYLTEISGEDILQGVIFKGRINLWHKFSVLDDYYFDDDEEFYHDPYEGIRDSLTVTFIFKERNRATLIHAPNDHLPKFKGTWADIFLEMVDIIRRDCCNDPKPPSKIPSLVQLFIPGQT